MKPTTYTIFALPTIALSLLLAACAPFSPTSSHAGMCNELNSRMIFSGSTSDIRKAGIQESEQPLIERSYDAKCTLKSTLKLAILLFHLNMRMCFIIQDLNII